MAGSSGPESSSAPPTGARRFALVMVAFVVDVAFCLSVGGVLGMHARMAVVNCTTIEMFEKRRAADWPYDRGARRNLEEVFGTRWAVAIAFTQATPLVRVLWQRRLPSSNVYTSVVVGRMTCAALDEVRNDEDTCVVSAASACQAAQHAACLAGWQDALK